MPVRRQAPIMAVPRHHTYSAPSHDFGIEQSLNRADFLSSATLEDTYDAASRSRNKDKDLLRNVNSAIGTLQPKKPWYIERAERAQSVARERSVPPRSLRGASVPPQESPQSRRARAMSVPPPQPLPTANLRSSRRVLLVPRGLLLARARSLERSDEAGPNVPQSRARMIRTPIASHPSLSTSATQHLWAHRPIFLSKDRVLAARARSDPRNPHGARLRRASSEPRMLDRAEQSHHSYYIPDLPQSYRYYHRVPDAGERALTRHVYAHRGRYGPQAKPPRPSLVNFPQVYVPWYGPGPSNRSKAAIIGSKMEPEGRSSRRGPRSQFAQDKMREIRLDDLQRKYN